MTDTVVRARIDEETKDEAAAVLAAIGLTVSDAFRLMMVRIAKERALPFEPLVPNAETIEAMKAARRGEVVKNILLLVEHPRPVPLLAKLRPAAQIGDGINPAAFQPQKIFAIKRGRKADAEPSIPGQ